MTTQSAQRYRALSAGMVAIIMLIAFEYLAVATAMPEVARRLDGMRLYALAFNAGLVASVIATVAGGRWSDARGPIAPMWTGLAGFMAGLVVAGLAPTMDVFVAGRLIQGLGGGLFIVGMYVLIDQAYPADRHPRVFALLSAAWVIPSLVGPALTGLVTDQLGWRWVFLGVPLLAVPAAAVLWRGLAGVPNAPAVRQEPPAGAGGSGGFAAKITWGLLVAAGAALMQYGSGTSPIMLFGGLAILAVALPRLLPKGTLRARRGIPAVIALRGLAAGAFFAAEVFVPLLLNRERGLTLTEAGLALTGGAVFWSLASWIQGRAPHHRKRTLRIGTALIAVAIGLTALAVFPSIPVLVGFAAWCVGGFGIGLIYPTLSVLILELSEPGEKGANSASLMVGESVFAVVAVAVTGAVFAAMDRTHASYLVCFGGLVAMAVTATLISGRLDQTGRAGTMEV